MSNWTLAASLFVDGSGNLQGASGVDVQGSSYSVLFIDGTCGDVFSGCNDSSDFAFTTNAAATAATQALLDQVFIDGPAGAFDDDPALTSGCTATGDACFGNTPYAVGGGTVSICSAVNHPTDDGHGGDANACGTVPISTNTNTNESVWAVWTPDAPLDHFKCYEAEDEERFFERQIVLLSDQFEEKLTVVIKPELVCNPVDKNGEGINDPATHLVCYRIRDARGEPEFEARVVITEDQFGELLLEVEEPELLCVPALKTDLGPITDDDHDHHH